MASKSATPPLSFQYALGQLVASLGLFAHHTEAPYRIVKRRYDESAHRTDIHYLCHSTVFPLRAPHWAFETELIPYTEAPHATTHSCP